MLTMAILIAISVCLIWGSSEFSQKEKKGDIIGGVILGLMLSAFFFSIINFVPLIELRGQDIDFDKVELVKISNPGSQSSFFLKEGAGEGFSYRVRYKKPGSEVQLERIIPAERVNVYEENRRDAFMIKINKKPFYSPRAHIFFFPFESKGLFEWNYAIHIPNSH